MLSFIRNHRAELIVCSIIIAAIVAIAIPNMLASKRSANGAKASQIMRLMHSAESTYAQGNDGHFASAEVLGKEKLITQELAKAITTGGDFNGFTYKLKVDGDAFHVTGIPSKTIGTFRTGDRSFYIDETGVMRASHEATHEATASDASL